MTGIASLLCTSGYPIIFTCDFSQKIAKWVPQRNGYKRILIGPLLSCCYGISCHNDEFVYIQLDCNKIVVLDSQSVKEENVLSSCPCG